MRRALIPAASLLAFAALAATPAMAIQCNGNFQVQKGGNMIATPFCEDNNLASVAQQYGMNVSAHTIRQNPSEKERVCRLVGDDNRVRNTCAPYLNSHNQPDFH